MAELKNVTDMVGVVVGIDGSGCSLSALRWAMGQAALQGCTLHILTSWEIVSQIIPKEGAAYFPADLAEYGEFVRERLEKDVRPILAERTDVKFQLHVAHATPTDALVAASRDADLIVVGSRGRGGFLELALGSVADQVVRHSYCPVVVVRDPTRSALVSVDAVP